MQWSEKVRILDKLPHALFPVLLVDLVGVEYQLDIAPILEVLTRTKTESPAVGRATVQGLVFKRGDKETLFLIVCQVSSS